MNNIEKAVELLENGWCVGELESEEDSDKHCAVGAVAAASGFLVVNVENGIRYIDDDSTYGNFNASVEGKALAEEILDDTKPWFDMVGRKAWADGMTASYKDGAYDSVVFTFNDSQASPENVIEMFKHAAKRLD